MPDNFTGCGAKANTRLLPGFLPTGAVPAGSGHLRPDSERRQSPSIIFLLN